MNKGFFKPLKGERRSPGLGIWPDDRLEKDPEFVSDWGTHTNYYKREKIKIQRRLDGEDGN